jgi:hypothetical protein
MGGLTPAATTSSSTRQRNRCYLHVTDVATNRQCPRRFEVTAKRTSLLYHLVHHSTQ